MTRSDRFAASCSAAALCGLALCGLALWGLSPAAAADLPGGLQAKVEADIDLVLASHSAAAQSGPYGAVSLRWSADAVRASGLRWGLDVAGEALTGDGRRGLARHLSGCPACPQAPDGRALAGLVTGLSGDTGGAPASGQAGLSEASLWVQTGFVRLRAGVSEGAAGQERPDMPGTLRTLRADGGLIDPTGLALTDTGLSLAGPAPGVSIQTRRLIGLRATASYTPDADWRSVGRARAAGPDRVTAEVRDVWALGASFDRRSPQTGVRWRAYAGAETGRVTGPDAALMRDPWTVSARLSRARGDVSLGLAWLKTNDGLPGADYEALSASAAAERGDWLLSAEAGTARVGLAGREGRTFQLSASRLVGDHAVIGLAAGLGEETGAGLQDRRRARLALEAGLRF